MEDEGSTVRLVRCPKCENLLPELIEYSVYQCGGCGAVLRGTQSTPASEKRQLEKSGNESGTRVESTTKEKVSLESIETEEFELGSRKGRTVHEKVSNLTASSSSRKEKREILTESDQTRRKRLVFDQDKVKVFNDWDMNVPKYNVSSESQEIRHSFGPIRSRPVGIHRNASTVEKGRFGNLPYSNEGPSNSRCQDLENDRAELLKKLDDIRTQLTRSCNVSEFPNTRFNGSYPLPRQHPHQIPHQQYLPPTYHDPFLDYSQRYTMNWQPIPSKVRPFSSFNNQETNYSVPEPLTYGPRQLPRHQMGSLGSRYPRRRVILSHGNERVSRPISGGAPFIRCCNCFELLKIRRKITSLDKNSHKTIKCAVCSSLILLKLENNKIVASVSSPQKVNKRKSNRSPHSSLDYDFHLTDTEPNLSTSGAENSHEQNPDSVSDKPSSPIAFLESQDNELTKSQRTNVTSEIDVSLNEYLNCDEEDDQSRNKKGGNDYFFAGLIKKRLKDFSRSSNGVEKVRSDVFVNGQLLTYRKVKKAEKLAGPIHPGEYWYDSLAGFWGVMNQPCLGIIPPFIQEFDHPMPKKCAAGNTAVFVNGRELNQKDLDLLVSRGLPTAKNRSYIINISGKVVDEDTGEELECLGKLAPTVERVKHGFGMKVPKAMAK